MEKIEGNALFYTIRKMTLQWVFGCVCTHHCEREGWSKNWNDVIYGLSLSGLNQLELDDRFLTIKQKLPFYL